MKNTFYRPEKINCSELQEIVNKLEKDLDELSTGNVSEEELKEYVRELIKQGEPLAHNPKMICWGLDKPENMPSDARVDFFYRPSYIAACILSNAYMIYPDIIDIKGFTVTFRGSLVTSIGRNFLGSGYDDFEGLIDTFTLFAKSDIFKFVEKNPEYCPEFTNQFILAINFLTEKLEKGKVIDPWTGEQMTKEIMRISEILRKWAKK